MSEPPVRATRAARLTGAVLFALFLALYLWTFPLGSDGLVFGTDATTYAYFLARGIHWHPHHLLFHPVAAIVLRVREALFTDEGPVYAALGAQRFVSAVCGAGIVVLVHSFAARRLGALRGALIAGVLGLSTGMWFYAAVGETQTPATLPVTALLVVAAVERLEGRSGPAWRHVALLLCATLVRQDGVLVLPAYLVLVGPRRGLVVAAYAGVFSLGLYGLAWRIAAPPLGFADWLHMLALGGSWNTSTGVLASARIALASTASALVDSHSLHGVSPWSAAALVGLGAALVVGRRRRGRAPVQRVACGLLAFAATRFGFYAWWEPTNLEFHGPTWVPLLMLLALFLDRERAMRAQVAFLALAVLATGIGAPRASLLPHRDDPLREHARRAIATAGPGGAVLALDSPLEFALMRESPASVDISRALLKAVPPARARIAAAHARGGRALLASDDVLALRMPERSFAPPPDLLRALSEGYEVVALEPWLVELVAP